MYKLKISKSNVIDISDSYNNQKNIIGMLHNTYSAEVREYINNDGVIYNNGTVLSGGYFYDLESASKFNTEADKVVQIMKKTLSVNNKSTVLILKTVDKELRGKRKKEVISVINNITDRNYIHELLPCRVDYIVIITADKDFGDILESKIVYDATSRDTLIGHREVDIFISEVG